MLTYKTNKGSVWLLPLALLTVAVLAPGAWAQVAPIPACNTTTTLDQYVGGYECTIDGYTLGGFTFNESTPNEDQNLLPANDIVVVPTVVSNGVSVDFFPTDDNSFEIYFGSAEYQVQYELDPLLPNIAGPSIDLGPNDPVTLTGEFCGDGTITSTYPSTLVCAGSATTGIFPLTLVTSGDNTSASATFPTVVTDLDSLLVLDLNVGDDGNPVGTQYFGSTAILSTASTPEPSTAFSLPILLAVLWFGKKRFAKAE